MRFSAATLLALAASATAAVIPRSQYGQFKTSVTVLKDGRQFVSATYTSDSYPDGLRSSCVLNSPADGCDRAAFSSSWDGEILKVQLTVEKPDPMTVFAEGPVELGDDNGYRVVGYADLEVTKAIA